MPHRFGLFALLPLSFTVWAQPLPPGHPSTDTQAPPSFASLAEKLESSKEKTFETSVSLGKLYSSHGLPQKAAKAFQQASQLAAPLTRLYARLKTETKGQTPAAVTDETCGFSAGDTLLQQTQAVERKTKEPSVALGCAEKALEKVREIERLWANAQFLSGDAGGAKATYTRLANVFEVPFGHYGLAMVLIDTEGDNVSSLKKAVTELERFLQNAPGASQAQHARQMKAWAERGITAGGIGALNASAKKAPTALPKAPMLAPEVVDAFQNAEQTPEMQAQFGKLLDDAEEHLARGRFQNALDAYKSVMPYQPKNGRVQAGMAWALHGLQKPMAERVWTVAMQQNPESIDALAKTLDSKGDKTGARAIRERKETFRNSNEASR